MNVSQKCQYALRAIFELARRWGQGPTRIADIAKTQAIPAKFLELILGELKHAGFVESRRGIQGGYLLAVPPHTLSVGQVIEFVDGPVIPVNCLAGSNEAQCPLKGSCAFMGMWIRARDAVASIYDETTFQDLLDEEMAAQEMRVLNYCI